LVQTGYIFIGGRYGDVFQPDTVAGIEHANGSTSTNQPWFRDSSAEPDETLLLYSTGVSIMDSMDIFADAIDFNMLLMRRERDEERETIDCERCNNLALDQGATRNKIDFGLIFM